MANRLSVPKTFCDCERRASMASGIISVTTTSARHPRRFSDSGLAASLGSTGLPNYFRRANPTKRRNKTLELDEVIE
jgi:hypothetical protein